MVTVRWCGGWACLLRSPSSHSHQSSCRLVGTAVSAYRCIKSRLTDTLAHSFAAQCAHGSCSLPGGSQPTHAIKFALTSMLLTAMMTQPKCSLHSSGAPTSTWPSVSSQHLEPHLTARCVASASISLTPPVAVQHEAGQQASSPGSRYSGVSQRPTT